MSPMTSRIYTLEEIKLHNLPNDLWMVIYNKVYDVTKFSRKHPGGIEVLLDCGGQDATAAFRDVGHSDFALTMLTPYILGEIASGNSITLPKHTDDKVFIIESRLDFVWRYANVLIIGVLLLCIITIQLVKWSYL